jgi:hypothetical protein
MARWRGEADSLGRIRQAAVLWALRRLLGYVTDHAVILVRVNPGDDEYCTVSVETGDPAVCEAMATEYLDECVPADVGEIDEDDDD